MPLVSDSPPTWTLSTQSGVTSSRQPSVRLHLFCCQQQHHKFGSLRARASLTAACLTARRQLFARLYARRRHSRLLASRLLHRPQAVSSPPRRRFAPPRLRSLSLAPCARFARATLASLAALLAIARRPYISPASNLRAFPLWLILSFSSADNSANDLSPTINTGSKPNPPLPQISCPI